MVDYNGDGNHVATHSTDLENVILRYHNFYVWDKIGFNQSQVLLVRTIRQPDNTASWSYRWLWSGIHSIQLGQVVLIWRSSLHYTLDQRVTKRLTVMPWAGFDRCVAWLIILLLLVSNRSERFGVCHAIATWISISVDMIVNWISWHYGKCGTERETEIMGKVRVRIGCDRMTGWQIIVIGIMWWNSEAEKCGVGSMLCRYFFAYVLHIILCICTTHLI